MATEQTTLSSKEKKQKKVEKYAQMIKDSEALFLADTSLGAIETSEFKKALAEQNSKYHVISNRLFSLALDKAVKDKPTIKGFTGVVFCGDDPVGAAKKLYELVKENKAEVKFGYYAGEKIDSERAKVLSELPGHDELLGKVVYMVSYPISGLMNVLKGPMRQLVVVLNAVAERKA